jgi:hypothetical protein
MRKNKMLPGVFFFTRGIRNAGVAYGPWRRLIAWLLRKRLLAEQILPLGCSRLPHNAVAWLHQAWGFPLCLFICTSFLGSELFPSIIFF